MNGAPVDIDHERRWYKRLCKLHGIDMAGAHFLLVPHGFDVDGNAWDVLHGESMVTINDYELEDGETVEDLAAHLRECMPGAKVQPPCVVGRMHVSAT